MTTWKDYKQSITSINDDEMTIINTLSQLQAERIRRGISQKDFAEQIKMKQPQLAKIERLDSMPSLTTLNRYAHGLGLEIEIRLRPVEAM
ncbi:helix-turn-helix domain-containing protein [Lactiplantibacillus modestisalitolerans]|uniref:Helix-turn-helix domain-containing protein n=1 Tax=Lactiplantibacillus modestisalitolerans TaxID=1457219 RepID=A0ABV5WTN8_9LACO|nr:helix-turn-helix transcriptional regulator [Lactiplantibacillus modestisalitolerans]